MSGRLLHAWILVALGVSSLAGCGSATSEAAVPRACALLTDSDVAAATQQTPSSVGGADAGDRSSCVWALPNQAGGSVSAVLLTCTSAGACSSRFTSMTTGQFADLTGLGDRARISTRAGAGDGIVVLRGLRILQLLVDHLDVDAAGALRELAGRAARRL